MENEVPRPPQGGRTTPVQSGQSKHLVKRWPHVAVDDQGICTKVGGGEGGNQWSYNYSYYNNYTYDKNE